MIAFTEAQSLILSKARSFGSESVLLTNADGRVLDEDIRADRNYPPFNRAMMDGYAFMLTDWEAGIRSFIILETIFAGQSHTKNLVPGTCYKIMTGAAVPEPANAVIRREDSVERDGMVALDVPAVKAFQHIALKGEDAKEGEVIMTGPLLCEPAVISLLAAVGKYRVSVKKLPHVAVVTTGNEIVSPEEPVSDLQIRNGNQFLLNSLLKKHTITPSFCRHVSDDQAQLTEVLKNAIANDIVIVNGGVSAGDADYVPSVLESLGVKKLFHKVSIRPGKPLWCGETETGGVVFALPGNPLSCLTTFTIFIEPYLLRCLGLKRFNTLKMPLLQPRTKTSQLTEFFPVVIDGESGYVKQLNYNSSGDITAALRADGLGVQADESKTINAGENILIYPFQKFSRSL